MEESSKVVDLYKVIEDWSQVLSVSQPHDDSRIPPTPIPSLLLTHSGVQLIFSAVTTEYRVYISKSISH
jgi:hypothetical protein